MMTILTLARAGFGSVRELLEMDTPAILDMVEYHQMTEALAAHEADEARRKAERGRHNYK